MDETPHELVGIGASFVDFQSAMATKESLYGDLYGCVAFVRGLFFVFEFGVLIYSASRTYYHFSLGLVVKV